MILPPPQTPLYNHPLPKIEAWLISWGCEQDQTELHCWYLKQASWKAEISLEIDQLIVRYLQAGNEGQDVLRSFKYSLSRQDIEAAIFSGP